MIWLRTNALILAAAAVLILLAFAVGRCDGQSAERARMNAAREKANVEAIQRDSEAKEKAAAERARDNARITNEQQELVNAIESVPDTVPDDLRVRAACQRLRAQGRSEASLPEPCRSAR